MTNWNGSWLCLRCVNDDTQQPNTTHEKSMRPGDGRKLKSLPGSSPPWCSGACLTASQLEDRLQLDLGCGKLTPPCPGGSSFWTV